MIYRRSYQTFFPQLLSLPMKRSMVFLLTTPSFMFSAVVYDIQTSLPRLFISLPRAPLPFLLLGYPTNHKGYRCLDLTTGKVISRHSIFVVHLFSFSSIPHLLSVTLFQFLLSNFSPHLPLRPCPLHVRLSPCVPPLRHQLWPNATPLSFPLSCRT